MLYACMLPHDGRVARRAGALGVVEKGEGRRREDAGCAPKAIAVALRGTSGQPGLFGGEEREGRRMGRGRCWCLPCILLVHTGLAGRTAGGGGHAGSVHPLRMAVDRDRGGNGQLTADGVNGCKSTESMPPLIRR